MRVAFARFSALVWLAVWACAGPALAREHTARRHQQRQMAEASQAALLSEKAPDPEKSAPVCRLTVQLVADGRPAPAALVRVTNLATGKALSFEGGIHRGLNWHVVENGATLPVPQGRVRVEAFRGLATELAVQELDLAGRAAAVAGIRLEHFYDAGARGLRSGNTHLHLRNLTRAEADRYLTLVPQADELDLVFLSHLERKPEDRDYVSNGYRATDLARLSRGGLRFGNGEEHRHNFGPQGEGYGHVMFLDIRRLIQPVSIGPGIMKSGTDGLPLQYGIRQARADGATVIWCHNKLGHEDLPSWVGGLLHAQNIFDGGSEGDYADTFYRYLDVGLKVPFSTGTDWFIEDFARAYVAVAGDWTPRGWLSALADGRSYISNGVFLELEVDGRGIGATIPVRAGQEVQVAGRAVGRNDFGRLELVHDGAVVHAEPAVRDAGHFSAALQQRVRVAEPGWIALRVPTGAGTNELGKPLFAHTSPVYLELEERRRFRVEVARGILAEMQQSLALVAEQGRFGGEQERERVLGVYREAIRALEARLR